MHSLKRAAASRFPEVLGTNKRSTLGRGELQWIPENRRRCHNDVAASREINDAGPSRTLAKSLLVQQLFQVHVLHSSPSVSPQTASFWVPEENRERAQPQRLKRSFADPEIEEPFLLFQRKWTRLYLLPSSLANCQTDKSHDAAARKEGIARIFNSSALPVWMEVASCRRDQEKLPFLR